MKTLPAFAVIAVACLTTIMPADFAFGIATRAADVATTIVVSRAAAYQSYKLGQLVIEAPWARTTPKGAQVGGG